jgi:FtsP/CotA-like multicopper oxidase with cupredoxin domain
MIMRAFFLSVAVMACAAAAHAQSVQPAGWDANLKLKEAEDRNPDPKVVEIDLEARVASLEIVPGVRTNAWTYNGGLPGPLIHVRRGDRLIVHFSNRLPQPTTVHWHGVQVPIEMDGVPGVSQPPVQPGGSFTYDFVVPDAGLFWYHPHVMSAAQVGFGLYGALRWTIPTSALMPWINSCWCSATLRSKTGAASCNRQTAGVPLALSSGAKGIMCWSMAANGR